MTIQKIYQDHLGNEYPSQGIMCDHYNVNQSTFHTRRKNKMSLQEALLTPKLDLTVKDHLGITYASTQKMTKHYGINNETYRDRINAGMSIEKALMTKPGQKENNQCYDHLGNKYESINNMCEHYGIGAKTYAHRINHSKMTVEEALTTPLKCGKKAVTDHLGKKFTSITQMCKYHNCSRDAYDSRRKNGLDIEQALKPSKHRPIANLPIERIGETTIIRNGMTLTITHYETAMNLTVQFEDGQVRNNIQYDNFKKHNVKYPKQYQTLKIKSLAYHVSDRWAFYVKCEKCGVSDIMTYEQMQEHECCRESENKNDNTKTHRISA